MADSQGPESEQRLRTVPRWLGIGLVTGSTLLFVGAGATWRGWVWLQNNLTPWLEAELTTALNRPVELGDLERLTLSGVRVGPSQIPATATDPDFLSLQAVEVQVNPRDLLRRELILDIVLDQVDLYVAQAADGQWVALELNLPEQDEDAPDPWINVQPGTLHLRDSRVVLVPYDRRQDLASPPGQDRAASPRIELTDLSGRVEFGLGTAGHSGGQRSRIDQLNFEISGTSTAGGSIQTKGAVQLPQPGTGSPRPTSPRTKSPSTTHLGTTDPSSADTQYPTAIQALRSWVTGLAPAWAQGEPSADRPLRARANVRLQDLTATDIVPLVESFLEDPLPVQIPSGTVSGAVDITLGEDPPTVTGTARVEGGTVVTPGLPEPIQDIQGDVRFQERTFLFENVTARLKEVTAAAQGTLDLDQGYDLTGRVNPFTVAQATELFGLELPVATAGTFIADVTLVGPIEQPVITTELLSQDRVVIDQVALAQVQAKTTLQGQDVIIDGFQLVPEAGGSLTGNGRWTSGPTGQLTLAMTGTQLPADALGRPYGLPDTVTVGPVSLEANLAGPLDNLTGQGRWRASLGTYPSQGRVAWANQTLAFTDTFVQVAGGTVAGNGTVALDSQRWQADVRATGLSLAALGAGIAGEINGRGELRGPLGDNLLAELEGQGIAQAVLAGGVVNGRANLGQGRWRANVVGQQLSLAAFSPPLQGTGSGQFEFSGPTADLTLAAVRGQGQLALSDGLATAATLAPQLAAVREPLRADLAWDGQSVRVNQASTAGLQANGVVTPFLSGPGAPGIDRLDLNLAARGVNLAALPIPGQIVPVAGVGTFAGRLVGRPGTLRLTGDARLDNVALSEVAFATPLTGPVFYDQRQGFTVDLRDPSQRETGDRLLATSQQDPYDLKFTLRSGPTLADGHLQGSELFATLTNLPLDDLRLPQGGIEGVGTVSGTVESAVISGNWREPNLQAQFDIVDPGLGYINPVSVQPIANPDHTAALTDDPPTDLQVRYGRLRGTLRYANQIVSLVGGELVTASESSRYLLSGTYALDGSQQVNGELVVDNAQIQDLLLTFKIFELSDLRLNLLQPPDWFRPTTAADLASLDTTQVGDRNAAFLDQLRRFAEALALQDLLDLQAETAAFPPLYGLEGRFSGTVTAQGALPRQVRVEMDLAGSNWLWRDPSHPSGIAYRLDRILAQATYADDLLRLRPLRLTSTFPSDDPENPTVATAELNGDFSLDPTDMDRTLRLNIADLPLDAVRRPLRIPDTFDGFINAGASLTGGLANPQMRGRLAVNEATINRQPIDVASADFLYQQARLNLRSNVAIEDQVDPLTLLASVPLPLPGGSSLPSQDAVTVRLRLKDQGFALMNLFTQAVTWEEGEAELALNVDGFWPVNQPIEDALTSLVVSGAAKFDGVTLSSRSLPEPLTNLQGDVVVLQGEGSDQSLYINGLVLDFQNVQGDFSAGQLAAQGQLKVLPSIHDVAPGLVARPFASPRDDAASQDNRFRLTLDNIALDLRNAAGTYTGRLDGDVVVGGSLYLLEPTLSGNLRLSNGILTLPESQDEIALVGGGGLGSFSPSVYQPLPPALEDFSISLAENVRIMIPNLVDVSAQGDLNLLGSVPDVRPDGRIMMPSGRINLFTTEFRLTGNENYAEFSANDDPIDPYLVANLSAAVSDTLGNSTSLAAASPFPRNEVIDDPISQLGLTQNGVQTIRIRANVNGRASRVVQLQGVELSSTPPRSEGEIITLISNEFLTALESTLGSVSGGGDNFQGLFAFAGSAILNRIQNLIGTGIDNTELRLYSASPSGSQQVDVGGEVSFNVSPSLGLSVQKVFTNISPVLFGVRYRITDQITVRAITSYEQFNENTGAIVEFRF